MYIKERLQELLRDSSLNLSSIARFAGCAPQTLYGIRDGKQIPSIQTLHGLARAFGKPMEYFFDQESKHDYNKASGQ